MVLAICGVKLRQVSEVIRQSDLRGCLIVANHLSYLDVLAFAVVVPGVFVTSVEVEGSGFLGWISRAGGAIFVERRNLGSLRRDLKKVRDVLAMGFPVIIFPEGTSSNGEGVLPFRPGLLAAADSFVPACIWYRSIDGAVVGPGNRDKVCYYGDMNFFPHLSEVLKLREIEVAIDFLEPVRVSPGASRKELGLRELARTLRERIASRYAQNNSLHQ